MAMTKTLRILVPALVIGSLMVACSCEDGVTLTAPLSGDETVCEGGTCGGDATGIADIGINADRTKICWEVTGLVGSVDDVTALHIHSGEAGDLGPVVAEFLSGNMACAEVSPGGFTRSLLRDLTANPASFYVDVHSERYPDGVARGQLEPVSR